MDDGDKTFVLAAVLILAYAVLLLARKTDSLDEDVELLADGDTALVKAKRRVARETRRMT